MSRSILFAEVPCFYAMAIERAPGSRAWRERPVIVGGDPRKRGLVQAASRPTRSPPAWSSTCHVLEALKPAAPAPGP